MHFPHMLPLSVICQKRVCPKVQDINLADKSPEDRFLLCKELEEETIFPLIKKYSFGSLQP